MKTEGKRLRGYLKGYRICLLQAKSIEIQIAESKMVETVRELLCKSKKEFEQHCRNVQIILGQTKADGIERSVLTLRYIEGKSMKEIAKCLGYNEGYCANVEGKAIERLSRDGFVMNLLPKAIK